MVGEMKTGACAVLFRQTQPLIYSDRDGMRVKDHFIIQRHISGHGATIKYPDMIHQSLDLVYRVFNSATHQVPYLAT